ncbi:MAG: SusC/RagA family TonB-linked outer membrane protein [Ginsengibacter sp.]
MGGGTAIPGWYYSPANPRVQGLSPEGQASAAKILDSISKINVNWNDEIFRQGNFSNHQINLSGGTGKTRMFSSLALYNEEGTTTRTDMQRLTFRNNMDYSDDKFTASISTSFGYTKRNFQQETGAFLTNPFLIGSVQVPYAKVYNEDGNYATGTGAKFGGANQLDYTKYDRNYNDQIKATVGVNLQYKITPDITASLTSGVDFRETQNTNYGSKLAYGRLTSTSLTGKAGFQQEALSRFATSSVRPMLNFQKMIGEKSDVDVIVLGEYVQENYKSFNFTGYGIDPRTPNTPAVITPGNEDNKLYSRVGGQKGRTGLASGLAMARYTYDGKYTLSGSYRTDGSSKLPVVNRWRDFFSVGAIWDVSKEEFLHNVDFVNVLRLRASYGSSGNSNNFPGDYLYQATYSSSGDYAGLTTQFATYPGYPDAKWEVTYQTNLGLDFQLFNRRLYGDLNWYDKRTKDLFVRRTLPAEAGSFAVNVNAGELQNTGFEWNINGEVLRTKDLVWTIFANGAYNKNKLLDLGGEEPYESGTSYLKIGYPLGTHYSVKWGGVDAATGAPLYYDTEGNLTTNYSASNSVLDFGTWEAPWKGGFGTTVRYKSFDLNVLFSWQQGANKLDNLEYFAENPVGFLAAGYNQSSDLNFWKKPGDLASTPSPLYGTNFSSKLIHDASFMRLKDVTIGYNLPNTVVENLKYISNARLFVQGSNLFIWTNWRGMDPEAGAVNINLAEFPNSRALTGGVKVTF